MIMINKTEVLIVDDSAVVRKLLTNILEKDNTIEVIGAVGDPYQAVERIKKRNPDVITLDVEMPRMSGLDFLKKDQLDLLLSWIDDKEHID